MRALKGEVVVIEHYLHRLESGILALCELTPDGCRSGKQFYFPGDLIGEHGGANSEFYAVTDLELASVFTDDGLVASLKRQLARAAFMTQLRWLPLAESLPQLLDFLGTEIGKVQGEAALIKLSHKDLALLLGTSRESTSKHISALSRGPRLKSKYRALLWRRDMQSATT